MKPQYMEIVDAARKSMDAGKYQAAITDFERAIKLDAGEPLAYVGLAETLSSQGNFEEAVGAAREAVRQRPNFGRAQLALAQSLCHFAAAKETPDAKSESMDEALKSYDIATSLNARMDPIPVLDEWRTARDKENADAQRTRNQEARVRRWTETRERYGLADIPFGDTSEDNKAILDQENTTENGKRWRSEYYHAKRKY